LLSHDFVTGSERNERFKSATHRDGHAILHVECDSVMERAHFVHLEFLSAVKLLFNLYGSVYQAKPICSKVCHCRMLLRGIPSFH